MCVQRPAAVVLPEPVVRRAPPGRTNDGDNVVVGMFVMRGFASLFASAARASVPWINLGPCEPPASPPTMAFFPFPVHIHAHHALLLGAWRNEHGPECGKVARKAARFLRGSFHTAPLLPAHQPLFSGGRRLETRHKANQKEGSAERKAVPGGGGGGGSRSMH